MDELRGPNVQIVLHLKEGLGFGFLRTPFVVSGSLNGYMLETDPVVPTHAPVFDAELVWEADKRRFRSLRVQNVPVKVEVYATGTQGRKDKLGYLLLSLLSAQPCPSNKINDRNELRMFHSNEVAYLSTGDKMNTAAGRTVLLSLEEYMKESKKTVASPDLQPRLICDEGLIEIGAGKQLYILSLVIGAVENLDMLLSEKVTENNPVDCYVSYSVFTHDIMTDRVRARSEATMVQFNQRTSLRLRGDLNALSRYFADCPHLVARVCARDQDIGICSMDLRKLVPTEDLSVFTGQFCNTDNALSIHERCYILRCDGATSQDARRPYVDIEMSLKYLGMKNDIVQKPPIYAARSVTGLEGDRQGTEEISATLAYNGGSCTDVRRDTHTRAYTDIDARNTARYKNAAGDPIIQSNEIAELIKKMYESFTLNQEKLLASRLRPTTSDMQVQCDPERRDACAHVETTGEDGGNELERDGEQLDKGSGRIKIDTIPVKLETSKSDTYIQSTEKVKRAMTPRERDEIMQRVVDELEDWKEKQQELYKLQLKRKEEYHLELLAKEWEKQRIELESKLRRGVEQCRTLASDLARATEDFRLRGYRNTHREHKLLEAKKALEAHYTAKYQELREASQKMEDDMNHQLKIKDMRIEELELKVLSMEKQVDVLKNNFKNIEKEAESKYSGLTKDQTASLIQELRCLEEKLDSAMQSKAFFKEQWGRAVRELHLTKLGTRRQMLTQLQHERRQLHDMGLDTVTDQEENVANQNNVDIKKLKDDFYVDILANTPALDSHSIISTTGPVGMDIYDEINKCTDKSPVNDKLSSLISQREQLSRQPTPDPALMRHLSAEIRAMLLNCTT
ncbi:unnamed protein product [Chilo suppressalis]|uniref:DUF3668 domain-containing protein n=1 Tax=Chilo suppressalis TaxID=168631 RepID=A0ABN8L292_CHISP|nr:unnamed protein product [Chilo suppressalis]